jgi:hypothetical protein
LPDHSDAAIRELARNILARREYASVNDKLDLRWQEWLTRLLDFLQNSLNRLVDWIGILRVNSPLLYWTVIGALVIAVAAMIAQIAWSIRGVLRKRARRAEQLPAQRPADLAQEARDLADSGRFLEAGHRLMIASFGVLAERSLIELRPDRSNRWIRDALRGSPLAEGLAVEVGALVERTERKWFGNRDNESGIYLDWTSVYQRLLSSRE